MSGTDLYGLLGIAKDADTNEIKKAFKKQAITHHPDKGGDVEEFKKIQHAYEILSDERRRQIYDMTGSEDGEMSGMGGGMGGMSGMGGMGVPFDLGSIFGNMANMGGMGMSGMFGMGNNGGPPRGQRVRRPKGPTKIHEIPLRLQDFYHGRSFQVKFERQMFCDACKGEGATSFQSCSPCQGRGIQRQVMMMGPIHMVNEGPCRECEGTGKKASGSCYICSGKKVRPQEKTLDVKIEPGMRPGEVLVFPKECSDDPNFEEPGDVHFILQEAAGDDSWVRKEDDLYIMIQISLAESLLGCVKELKGHPGFPNGLPVSIPVATQNKQVVVKPEQGMPKKSGSGGHGNLQVEVLVTVTEKDREVLERNKPLLGPMFGL